MTLRETALAAGTRWRDQIRDSFIHSRRGLALAFEASPSGLLGLGLLTAAAALLPLGIAYVGKLIVDAVVARDVPLTARYVALEAAIVGAHAGVQRGLFLCRSLLGDRLGLLINIRILEKALDLDVAHFEDSEFYDKLTRARREASMRPVQLVSDLGQLVQNALTLLGYIGLLLSFSVWIVFDLLIAALPATLAEIRFSNRAFRLRNWRSPDTRRLNYVEYVLANDAHVKEVKMLDLGPMLLGRYRELGHRFYDEDKALSIQRTGWAYGLSLLALGAFYGAYLLLGIRAARGAITLGNLTLYVMAFRQGQQAFQSCLTALGNMYDHNLYLSNLFEYLSMKLPSRKPAPRLAPAPIARAGEIRLEGVGFRYPGAAQWALRDITLTIPSAQSLALVGHNGAGKSTFIKLLCGLYLPTEGRILLDGVDLRDLAPEQLHQRLSVVFQDFNHYQFSFRENVGFGSLPFLQDDARIVRAVDRGGAKEVLESLPEGLETPLGKWFFAGTELSGGQWQKVALSRAFMREEADILILDEPTAALDAEAEHAVFERFRKLSEGRTSLLISHRFPTVRLADKIVVLEEGRILEQGTHAELLAAEGRYAALFSLQAQGYQ